MRKIVHTIVEKKKKQKLWIKCKNYWVEMETCYNNCPVPSQPNGFLGVFCPHHSNISTNGIGTLTGSFLFLPYAYSS